VQTQGEEHMTINISFSDKTVRVAVELNGGIESLITELPQREWVDLDIKQVDPLCEKYKDQPYKLYVEIRNLLKEKNT
jgi:hypothetical protein